LHMNFETDDRLVLGNHFWRQRGGGHIVYDFNAAARRRA
jgi:hypothetical protein